jgi:hypothetical protein
MEAYMKHLVYDLMYVDLNTIFRSLVVCAVAYFLISPFSKRVYKRSGYNPSNPTSKTIMYIAAALVIVTLVLNGAHSPLPDYMRVLFIIALVLLYGALVFANKGAGIVNSLIVSLLQVLGSVAYFIIFILSCLMDGSNNRSYGTTGTSSSGNQSIDRNELGVGANGNNGQADRDRQHYAEVEARSMGFHSAQEARESGFNIPE